MQSITFRKQVSKGSRFNQIYIPKQLEQDISVGDEVEVRLVKKHSLLYFSKGLRLSPFKESLLKDVLDFLSGFKEITHAFVVGSFLVEKVDYRDIDIVVIVEKTKEGMEERLYNQLIERFNLKFHVLAIAGDRFNYLLESCPLTRAMFAHFVSNRDVDVVRKNVVDTKHIQFLLMMPEDVMSITVGSRVFFDSIRRLVTIRRFLEGKRLTAEEINKDVLTLLGKGLFHALKQGELVDEKMVKEIRGVIGKLLVNVKGKLHGKKG